MFGGSGVINSSSYGRIGQGCEPRVETKSTGLWTAPIFAYFPLGSVSLKSHVGSLSFTAQFLIVQ